MTAVASPGRFTEVKPNAGDRQRRPTVDTGETIYPGALVMLLAGKAREAVTGEPTAHVCGFSVETAPKTAGERVLTREGECGPFTLSGATIADLGKIAYVVDDQTLTLDDADACAAGPIVDVTADGVYIDVSLAENARLAALVASGVQYRELTIGHADLSDADTSQTIDLGAELPAGATIMGVDFSDFTVFSGGTVSQLLLDIGSSGDVDAIRDGVDLDTAAVDGQPSAAPLGIAPNKHFAAATQLLATVVSTGDNLVNLTSGTITIRVFYRVVA